ncbi:phosphoesterase [Chthoniobacter flavus Ellin428]|uniref:Phosphoesterase n=1 Tax=Chthoniobacter flavus Ellin428 TaxID=497964 RepID=B4D6C9_9BACT|nr:alkaline phosphatase family protein [Chthoniobacter flavus]EDY18038.1 phosphoesterase [Chthoniobacter flavus Ellin428]TCO88281.1 acid phosphatase [Chthoniobacter flavus]
MNLSKPSPRSKYPILGASIASLLAISLHAQAAFSFLGVAAGDTSSNEAIVWTRGVDSAAPASTSVTLQYSTDQTFVTGVNTMSAATDGSAVADYTVKFDITGLQPSTVYYYRFVEPISGATSNVGKFKTAPTAATNYPLHFAFSGDCDGLIRPYALASQVANKSLDFFMFDGDTIYETASTGSAAAHSTGTLPDPTVVAATATQSQLIADYTRKYREQFIAVNASGQNGLQPFFAGQANYTTYDNHELGNKQYINGGAPAGGPVGSTTGSAPFDFTSGAGVDARTSLNDVNTSGTFLNQSGGFLALQNVFLNYQPMKNRGTVNAPSDPRTNGTKQLYFTQQWGRNAMFINTDCRSYRDIRMKTSGNADDTGSRADNLSRTYLGATQLAWLEQALLSAQQAGTTWKFINVSDPIDQLGPIGGALTLNNLPSFGAGSTYSPVSSDGGKAWMGGYRAERNALLKFIADNQIKNVVFLATDDHQNRVNEILYSPTGQTGVQSTYVKVPYCFEIVCGPLGATGPDLITNHSFDNMTKPLAQSIANAQVAAGVEPIGLGGYPGLHNVSRLGDPNADTNRGPEDFYSPDTFNYNVLDVSPDGRTLSVTSYGINSTAQNSFLEYDPVNNPEQPLFSFQIDAANALNSIDHIVVVYQENWPFDGLYGSFPGANGIANASAAALSQINRLTGSALSGDGPTSYNNPAFVPAAGQPATDQVKNPPVPLTTDAASGTGDTRVSSSTNTLQPYDLGSSINPTLTTGDIYHRYWQEQFQIFGTVTNPSTGDAEAGNNSGFVTWSDNPGLVMSHYDATNLPEGLLAQQYTINDNFFHSAFGGSFLNHQFLVSAAAPVYNNMPASNNGNIAYLDANGAFVMNTSGTANGKYVRDGSITPVAGDQITVTLNGASTPVTITSANTEAYAGAAGTTFDKHYVVNTTRSVNLGGNGENGLPGNGGTVLVSLLPSQNDSNPTNANGDTRPYIPTIGDQLSANNVSWKWYSGGWTQMLAYSGSNPSPTTSPSYSSVNASLQLQYHHQPFAYFDNYAPFDTTNVVPANFVGGFVGTGTGGLTFQQTGVTRAQNSAAHLQDETNFFTDVTNGTLPAVSFIKPVGVNNEHPGYATLQQGQAHVASIVQALQANPTLWAHTAVIVTYDEHGGRWDHVTPPLRDIWGPGERVPCIIISPLAKKGYVDHTQRDTSSILSTIEQRFGLQSLNQRDASAPTFADVFTALDIARGPFAVNQRARIITQAVTITNRGSVPMQGPVQLVLDNLSAGTALNNKTGVTVNNAPNGSPYITAATGSIAPGASVTVSLQFAMPSSGGVNYYARTVTGTTNP